MKWMALPLLVLGAASLLSTLSAAADTDDTSWEVGLLAANDDTVVSPDERYCRIPETMPIRPGYSAVLRDEASQLLGTTSFHDSVVVIPDPERFQAGEPCKLIARFRPIQPQDGLQIEIKSQPDSTERSPSSRVFIDLGVQVYGPFDWWYDELGYKECQPLGSLQIGDDSLVMTIPEARVQDAPDARVPRLSSNVFYDEARGEEYCSLIARLDFPIADEYVIKLGGENQDGE